jgi:hypothetical protein
LRMEKRKCGLILRFTNLSPAFRNPQSIDMDARAA